jgi:hypothetical protein
MPQWICHHEEERYIRLGKIVIRLEGTVEDQAKELDYMRAKWDLREAKHEAQLDQWYRKWYYTMPAGGAITLAITLLIVLL